MLGMRLGGIDPSILRELSGVYKPFVKAFKELVSNAFDADADAVCVEFADDVSCVTVVDNGVGMTPFEFRNDFTRIGGGSRRWLGERTRKGRRRIGSKGIGFLALARYCNSLDVESSASRSFKAEYRIETSEGPVPLDRLFGFPVPELFLRQVTFALRQTRGRVGKLKQGEHFRVDASRSELVFVRPIAGPFALRVTLDCAGIAFKATLDFDRLLELADKADLDKLEQFATIDLMGRDESSWKSGTRITARGLKSFVRRELQAERRKGYVRNIASRSGLERFNWHLSRCTPVDYQQHPESRGRLGSLLRLRRKASLFELIVSHRETTEKLGRPIYPFEPDALPLHDDMLIDVNINESGLKAIGFIAGYESVVFPAEYRGVTIRVRGVAIGDPSFLGAEYLLTGANKAALSQITGEINVSKGLDAVDALNPGRESFYEECEHFKLLRHHLLGDGETVGGCLGKAIAAVLRRSQVRSSLKDVVGRAALRRRVLDDIASAVSELVAADDPCAEGVRELLARRSSNTNGLADTPNFLITTPPRIGGLRVVQRENLAGPAEIDYQAGEVRLDKNRPEWDWTLVLFGRRLEVCNKKGGVHQPLGELDLRHDRLLLNWAHPIRTQMDERGFLRTAIAWILAKEAAQNNADRMMELALRLLSFRSGVIDG